MNLTVVVRLAAAYRLMLLVQPSSAAAEHILQNFFSSKQCQSLLLEDYINNGTV